MKTRNSSVEEFLKSPAKHFIFVEDDTCECECGYSKAYSPLERLVQTDMRKYGLHYPHVSEADIQVYWEQRL